jgi:predicted 3-demethylubiquinone-9 3-methyltransferase (glyoxalase superfamily)
MQKITPCLWYDNQAEEAALFYTSIFKNSKILQTTRYTELGPGQPGSVMVVYFQLEGQDFIALNGGPVFNFTPAISLSVDCKSQAEVDQLWQSLTAGGEESQCGWLIDRYGVSWQIVPSELVEMMNDQDPEKVKRATAAMFQMKKLDIAAVRQAYEGLEPVSTP